MSTHQHLTEQLAEKLTSYVLGLLTNQERLTIESHLAEGCAVCLDELARCGQAMAELANTVWETPAAALRQRLKEEIHPKEAPLHPASPVIFDEDGLSVLRTSEMEWKLVAKGLSVKVLFDDSARNMTTTIVRLDPETFYPAHQHKGIEEVFILQGELRVEGVQLRAGDFCLSQPDTVHQGSYSKSGCTMVVKSSKHDTVLR